MKSIINLLVLGAAVAGVVYLVRENEQAKGVLDKAKEKVSGALDKVKGSLYEARGEAKTQLADLP